MKTIRLLFLNLIALFIVCSCTIKQTINYHEDMSGSNEIIIDYGDFIEQMGSLMGDSTDLDKDIDMKESLGGLSESFKNMEGVTNLITLQEQKEGLVGFLFDFKDTESLNEAMSGVLGGEGSNKKNAPKSYWQKKNKLILDFDNQDLGKMKKSIGDESMMMLIGSFDYEFTVNLPFTIKSIDNKIYTVSADRKSISATVNLEDYISGNESLSTTVKW